MKNNLLELFRESVLDVLGEIIHCEPWDRKFILNYTRCRDLTDKNPDTRPNFLLVGSAQVPIDNHPLDDEYLSSTSLYQDGGDYYPIFDIVQPVEINRLIFIDAMNQQQYVICEDDLVVVRDGKNSKVTYQLKSFEDEEGTTVVLWDMCYEKKDEGHAHMPESLRLTKSQNNDTLYLTQLAEDDEIFLEIPFAEEDLFMLKLKVPNFSRMMQDIDEMAMAFPTARIPCSE